MTYHPNFLRAVLAVDAVTCVATGALMSLAASPLAEWMHLPRGLLFEAGLALLPIAAFMAIVAAQARPNPSAVWLIILGNAGWVVGSLLALMAVSPNGLGTAFVLVQAVAVAGLATLEYAGLRRTAASA